MPIPTLTIREVNALSSNEFIHIFGNVVEHYPAAAIGIIKNRPFNTATEISNAISEYLDQINTTEKANILQLHPDLVDAKSLTKESTKEQESAGLNALTVEQRNKLRELNQKYKEKFDFTFIVCTLNNRVDSIISSLEERIGNKREDEITNGIEEVKKISSLRIQQIVRE